MPLQAVFLTYLASLFLRVFDTADLNIIASMRRSFYAAFTRLSFKVAARICVPLTKGLSGLPERLSNVVDWPVTTAWQAVSSALLAAKKNFQPI